MEVTDWLVERVRLCEAVLATEPVPVRVALPDELRDPDWVGVWVLDDVRLREALCVTDEVIV